MRVAPRKKAAWLARVAASSSTLASRFGGGVLGFARADLLRRKVRLHTGRAVASPLHSRRRIPGVVLDGIIDAT